MAKMLEVRNEGARATVYVYGTIGEDFWSPEDENRAKEFARALDALSPKPLDIRIDSGGGDVYEGFAIASAIQRYEGETHVYIDGLAASAASYIALMGDKVTMNDYAMLMIHNAWCLTAGNSSELRDLADRLDALDGAIAGIITARSSLDEGQVREAMAAETWYTAADALEAGMCDEVIETGQRMAASIDKAIACRFSNVPECVAVREEEPDGSVGPPAPGGGSKQAGEDGDGATSHPPANLCGNEGTDAAGAILLGNRVYRKEN